VSAIQRETCALRIADSTTRARFVALLTRADALIYEAAELRRQAWSDYREATSAVRRDHKFVLSQYA
jgi:hypothetical protein